MKNKLGILILLVFALGILCASAAFAEKKETLVAAIESEGVELYDIGEGNFLLRCEGIPEPAELSGHPWRAEPQLRVFDYDGDGEKEVAVLLYLGGGSGVSIEDLFFFKKENGKLVECQYAPDGYVELLKQELGFKAWQEGGRLLIEFSVANDALRFDVTDDLGEDPVVDSERGPKCGDVVYFNFGDGGSVTITAAVGALVSSGYTPTYYADVKAKIIFTGGKASLEDLRLDGE